MNAFQGWSFFCVATTETDADVNGYSLGGGLDLGLTEKGIEEATKIAKKFRANPIKIKRIIASPELRTVQFADIFHDFVKVKLTLASDFKDQNLGALEGQKGVAADIVAMDLKNGEKANAFEQRITSVLKETKALNELMVLITHPRVLRVVFNLIGLQDEFIARGVVYSISIPEGGGRPLITKI